MNNAAIETESRYKAIKIKQEMAIRKSRRSFWAYTQLKAGEFYKKDRFFLRRMCNTIQEFYENDKDDVLIVNMPPRHGKSRTGGLFVEWALGDDPTLKIMTGSYNELLSTTFSRSVRNSIMEKKADELHTIYSDIFPHTRINRNHSSVSLWGLEGEPHSYLATSPSGTATGFGADILIIDDLIKNSKEAFNSRVLNEHWDWFTQTMLSRLEEGGKIIIIMTRWHTNDLSGRASKYFKAEGRSVKEVTMKALQDDGTMLCDDILSRESYDARINAMGEEVARANYQQEPIDIKGRLYSNFKEYIDIPDNVVKRAAYTDTADTGSDYLATYIYDETKDKEAYIVDVIYTKEPMEVTEPLLAKKLYDNKVNECTIESNAGGRGYRRSVENIMRDKYRTNRTKFKDLHQTKNKEARILSNATWVMEHIYFPQNWRQKWPELYHALMSYQKEGKNENDDAQDALTGVAEQIINQTSVNLFRGGI